MMNATKILCIALIGLLFLPLSNNSGRAEMTLSNHAIVTAHSLPYSIQSAKNHGLIIDMVREIEKRLGTNKEATFYPWPRAQQITLHNANHIIFPLARTQAREEKYTWLIDLVPLEFVFVSLDKPIESIQDAKMLSAISVRAATPFERTLHKHQFDNVLTSAQDAEKHLELLKRERVQAWFGSKQMIEYTIKKENFKEPVFFSKPIVSKRVYIAGSKHMNPKLVKAYQLIYNEMVQEGFIDQILQRYK